MQCYRFVLFDSPKIGYLMTPEESEQETSFENTTLCCAPTGDCLSK